MFKNYSISFSKKLDQKLKIFYLRLLTQFGGALQKINSLNFCGFWLCFIDNFDINFCESKLTNLFIILHVLSKKKTSLQNGLIQST